MNTKPVARKRLIPFLWLPAALLFGGLLLLRVPFLSNPLVGEEGDFAYLAVDTGKGPIGAGPNLLIGRVGGQDVFGGPQHPIPPYLLLTRVFRPLLEVYSFGDLSLERKSLLGRLPFLACFGVGLVAVFLLGRRLFTTAPRRLVLALPLLAFAATSPLLVGGSIQPQMDGSLGVMLVGLAAACLCGASGGAPRGVQVVFAFLGAFVASLGKNEWALALLAATVGGVGAFLLARRFYPGGEWQGSRSVGWIAAGVTAGLIGGSLFSFWLDPANYLGGLHVMTRTQAATVTHWPATFRARLPWIWPVLAILLAAAAVVPGQLRKLLSEEFGLFVLLLWGCGLTAGFLASSWSGDDFPRYFCTPMFALLCFGMRLLRRAQVPRILEAGLAFLLCAGVVLNLGKLNHAYRKQISITSTPGKSLPAIVLSARDRYAQFLQSGRVVEADTAFGYYFPDADFVSDSLGPEGVKRFLRERGQGGVSLPGVPEPAPGEGITVWER